MSVQPNDSDPNKFIGREAELRHLAQLVRRNKSRFTPIVVTGAPGLGKTRLVAEYLSHHSPYVPYSPQFESLNCFKWLQLSHSSNPERIIDEFLVQVRIDKNTTKLIVVLDDADVISPARLPAIFDRLFNYKRIENIIVTTRNALKLSDFHRFEPFYLESLSPENAVKLLMTVSPKELPHDAALALVGQVNSNPLAVNLLGALLKDRSLTDLLASFKKNLYSLDSISHLATPQIIKIVQPQIITTNSFIIEGLKKNFESIYQLRPRQFEEIIAEVLSDQGCEVELLQETHDGGVDILAFINTEIGRFLCLVETKLYKKERTVGVGLVRNLYGTLCDYQANSAMLVTTSRYSKAARILQGRHNYQLSLKDYTDVSDWIYKYRGK